MNESQYFRFYSPICALLSRIYTNDLSMMFAHPLGLLGSMGQGQPPHTCGKIPNLKDKTLITDSHRPAPFSQYFVIELYLDNSNLEFILILCGVAAMLRITFSIPMTFISSSNESSASSKSLSIGMRYDLRNPSPFLIVTL